MCHMIRGLCPFTSSHLTEGVFDLTIITFIRWKTGLYRGEAQNHMPKISFLKLPFSKFNNVHFFYVALVIVDEEFSAFTVRGVFKRPKRQQMERVFFPKNRPKAPEMRQVILTVLDCTVCGEGMQKNIRLIIAITKLFHASSDLTRSGSAYKSKLGENCYTFSRHSQVVVYHLAFLLADLTASQISLTVLLELVFHVQIVFFSLAPMACLTNR